MAVIPSAPIIISDLGGQSNVALELRNRVFDAVEWLLAGHSGQLDVSREIAIVYLPREWDYTAATGSLHPWGSTAKVTGGNYLPELIARWVLATVFDRLPDDAIFSSVDSALAAGYSTLLVIADGPSGLAEGSPIGFKEQAAACDTYCSAQFAPQQCETKNAAPAGGINERTARECGWRDYRLWKELRALKPSSSQRLYSAAPFGIGYHVHTMIIDNVNSN